MHARSAVVEMAAEKIDDVVRQFQEEALPRYREIPGYRGFKLLVDREGGKALGVSFWETEEGISQSDELGARTRQSMAETGGGTAQTREVWEVAIDDQG